jgi:hypothetical protein
MNVLQKVFPLSLLVILFFFLYFEVNKYSF